MADLSMPNDTPGRCVKCRGSGRFCWGGTVNGRPAKSGQCHACQGSGRQSQSDIARNHAFNRHQIARILSSDGY